MVCKKFSVCASNETFIFCSWLLRGLWHIIKWYRECHEFRLTNKNDYFWLLFDCFWRVCHFWGSWDSRHIGLSLKPGHYYQIWSTVKRSICKNHHKGEKNNEKVENPCSRRSQSSVTVKHMTSHMFSLPDGHPINWILSLKSKLVIFIALP